MQNPTDNRDEQLLHRMQAGDIEAFEILFTKYKQHIFKGAYSRLRNKKEAWDITLEVYSWLWLMKATISPTSCIHSLLISEVRKRIIFHP
jgi:DNA-directed RNA polymerase specialized sigma24 family protein